MGQNLPHGFGAKKETYPDAICHQIAEASAKVWTRKRLPSFMRGGGMTNYSGPGPRTVTAAAMAVAMVAVPAVLTAAAMVAVTSLAMPIAAMAVAMTKAMATDAHQVNLVILHGGPGDNRAQQNLKQER